MKEVYKWAFSGRTHYSWKSPYCRSFDWTIYLMRDCLHDKNAHGSGHIPKKLILMNWWTTPSFLQLDFFLLDGTNKTKLVYIVWSVSKLIMLHNVYIEHIVKLIVVWGHGKTIRISDPYCGVLGHSRVDTNGFSRASCISTLFLWSTRHSFLVNFWNLVFILICGWYCIICCPLFYLVLFALFLSVFWHRVWFKYFCHINSRFVFSFHNFS